MAEWKTKQELIAKAQLEDLRDPARNKKAGPRNREEKPRESPLRHEIIAGKYFAIKWLPKSGIWEDQSIFSGDNFLCAGSWLDNKHFKVRVVCTPTKKSDITLVEHQGKLYIVPLYQLRNINEGITPI